MLAVSMVTTNFKASFIEEKKWRHHYVTPNTPWVPNIKIPYKIMILYVVISSKRLKIFW